MVKQFLLFLIFPLLVFADTVSVDSFVNDGIENQNLTGNITITHNKKDSVDATSFKLDNEQIIVSLVEEVPMTVNSDIVISVYQFELEGRPQGVYTLKPITVKVGKQKYQSLASSFEVKEAKGEQHFQSHSEQQNASTIFKLETFVDSPSPFYVGQRAKLSYRITYNKNIDLTSSNLPLLHVEGLKRIGDVKIEDNSENGVSYQNITQEVEASTPGIFLIGISTIEGNVYTMNSFGEKRPTEPRLHAEAPALQIIVNDFPKENKPLSFNGAVGHTLEGELSLLTTNTIELGEEIELRLFVTGPSNLDEMKLPNLACQPGFSGFFEMNDVLPLAKLEEKKKIFTIQIRPISNFVTAVPSIELAAFDPVTAKYITWNSKEIPLKIIKKNRIENYNAKDDLPSEEEIAHLIEKDNVLLPSLPIQPLKLIQFKNACYFLFLIPFLFLCLIAQLKAKKYRDSLPQKMRKTTSKEMLNKAKSLHNKGSDPDQVASLLAQSIALFIQENYKNKPIPSSIKALQNEIAGFRYGKKIDIGIKELIQQVEKAIGSSYALS